MGFRRRRRAVDEPAAADAAVVVDGVPATGARSARAAYARAALLVVLLLGAALAARALGDSALLGSPSALAAAIERVRAVPWLPVAFVLFYALVAGVGMPSTPLTLAGGALFGVLGGTALNWSGAMLGASVGYGLARWLGGDVAQRVLVGHPGGRASWVLGRLTPLNLFRLRVLPVAPFNVLNVAAGLARMPLRSYLVATGLGMLPGTVIYTYFADRVLAGVAEGSEGAWWQAVGAGLVLVVLSFVPGVVGRGQRGGSGVG